MPATILYIEDNRQNMRLVRKMLASQGYEVLEASEGMIGIEVALTHLPDLIFVDINLPDIDGMEVTERLKAEEATRHIPIIALTANAMYGDREKFLDAGCDGYLAKPVSKGELVKTVQEYLGTDI